MEEMDGNLVFSIQIFCKLKTAQKNSLLLFFK